MITIIRAAATRGGGRAEGSPRPTRSATPPFSALRRSEARTGASGRPSRPSRPPLSLGRLGVAAPRFAPFRLPALHFRPSQPTRSLRKLRLFRALRRRRTAARRLPGGRSRHVHEGGRLHRDVCKLCAELPDRNYVHCTYKYVYTYINDYSYT